MWSVGLNYLPSDIEQALENIVYFIVLAPYDNEQSDMINHLNIDPALVKLELHRYAY